MAIPKTSRFFRYAVLVFLVLVYYNFFGRFWWYGFMTHRWEAQIRRHQNPAELQAWAASLMDRYRTSGVAETTILMVTNQPPAGIPISNYGPRVALMNDKIWGGGYHVQLGWGGGFLELWGMKIGDANFACDSNDKWAPGIYFFRSP